ncbi:MAG: glycosyltransferase family 4 protein [Brevefilum sp.]|nr:glycosyltransferase family 4 protein [Brevefilum sp.]MDT8382271.1 glycosyltransferase family 4 protein [Brevefilum sp.]MDW7755083.1 glycosyltransferase family 4 protein [Brevefilum sp.]
MKICFVHEYLIDYGGAEQVLKGLLEIWPNSPIFTLIFDPDGNCKEIIQSTEVIGSFLNKMPFAKSKHRAYLPLMPLAVEQLDLSGYDVVISASHAIAKGVITSPDQLHIGYIHTPIRYAWDMQKPYLEHAGLDKGLKSFFTRALLHYLRIWDMRTVAGVDYYIANSKFIARRIKKLYKREAEVIYPPVDISRFNVRSEKEDFYTTISRLVSYKKVDLIVRSFNQMPQKKLVVVGDGPELKSLKEIASNNITFLGFQDDSVVEDILQRARAFVYAAEEDFGIVPVEAQACGTPVIAYGKGGALETIIPGKTGYFFSEQSPEGIIQAVNAFEKSPHLDPWTIRKNAEKFSKARFKDQMEAFVEEKAAQFFSQINKQDREINGKKSK